MKINGWMVWCALAAQGCSEAREVVVDVGDTAVDAVVATDVPTAVDAGVAVDVGTRADVGARTDVGAGGLVVNEIRAARQRPTVSRRRSQR